MREDEELAAKLVAAQLIEEELVRKAEEGQRRERLDEAERMYEAEKKQREMEMEKGRRERRRRTTKQTKGLERKEKR